MCIDAENFLLTSPGESPFLKFGSIRYAENFLQCLASIFLNELTTVFLYLVHASLITRHLMLQQIRATLLLVCYHTLKIKIASYLFKSNKRF